MILKVKENNEVVFISEIKPETKIVDVFEFIGEQTGNLYFDDKERCFILEVWES